MSKSIKAGALFGLLLLVVMTAVGARMGVVHVPIERPPGHALWFASRAAGIVAYAALTVEMAFGLLVSSGAGDAWISRARSLELHRFLSVVSLSLVAGHALVLIGDRYVRFDVLDVLVPFLAPYRPFAVGLGVLGVYAMLLVHASFELRARIGTRAWRSLHYLSFAIFALATAHGALAGSDGWMKWGYAAAGGLILVLTIHRVLAARAAPRLRHAGG